MNTPKDPNPDWQAARTVLRNGKLSIIMPAHNLESQISRNLRTVHDTFLDHIPFEIIAVDDGSNDNTALEIEKTAKKFPEVKQVLLETNSGKGYALLEGFNNSSGSHVLFLDADLDLPPQQTYRMFEIMLSDNSDIVIGSKRHKNSRLNYPWHRRIISSVYYLMVKSLFGLSVHDTQTGIKLFRREALEYTNPRMLVKRFAFDLELLVIADEKGFKISESPVTLNFHLRFGCVRPRTVKQIVKDTLAIFYRSRILKYYRSIPSMQMPDKPPEVSILITYNKQTRFLDECLSAIADQTYPDWEVILLPDRMEKPAAAPENVKIVPTGEAKPSEKKNIGIKHAGGEIVAFLDNNAVPHFNWLKQAVIYFSSPKVGAVGGRERTAQNDPFMAKLSGRVYSSKLVSGNYRRRYAPARVLEIEDFPSCNFFVRKDILERLKGFRTDCWPGEDSMLCRDIVNKENKKIYYDPRIEVTHHRKKLFLPHLRQVARHAKHRGYMARTSPEISWKLSDTLPSLLVTGIVIGGAMATASDFLCKTYLSTIALYLLAILAASFNMRPLCWLLTSLGVILTHMTYGLYFVAGFTTKKKGSSAKSVGTESM